MSFLNNQLKYSAVKLCRRLHQAQTKLQVKVPLLTGGPTFRNAQFFPEKTAIRDRIASYTYANIFMCANELSKEISSLVQGKTNERILFLCPNDVQYVITLWAIWMSGQIAVPLSTLHPKNLLLYYANDTSAKLLITTSEFAELMQRVARNSGSRLHVLDDKLKLNCTQMYADSLMDLEGGMPLEFYEKSEALILYTSGTTGSPKGVVLTHKNIGAQTTTLVEAWKWSADDVILHTLPLHHVHGIVNALLCPLYVGAKTMMLKKFNPNTVWSYLLGVTARPDDRKITLFTGVPTMYSSLINEYDKVFSKDPKMVEYIKNTFKNKIRLMISGSAPLPLSVYEKWLEISGHQLLERYGMTETGMVLSNVYDSNREPGYVGVPLPGVSVRLEATNDENTESKIVMECSNTDGTIVFKKNPPKDGNNASGELLVKGANVFKEYFKRPEATRKELIDGWFKTGDMCEYDVKKGKFKMLGRRSVDIIKSGGYKISAVEVEKHLLTHPDVKECAVLGLDDEKWGQKVVAVVVLKPDKELKAEELSEFVSQNLPKYFVPSEWNFVDHLPLNMMGKLNKKELIRNMFSG